MRMGPNSNASASGEYRWGEPYVEGPQEAVVLFTEKKVSNAGTEYLEVTLGLAPRPKADSGAKVRGVVFSSGPDAMDFIACIAPELVGKDFEVEQQLAGWRNRIVMINVITEQRDGYDPRPAVAQRPKVQNERGRYFADETCGPVGWLPKGAAAAPAPQTPVAAVNAAIQAGVDAAQEDDGFSW